MGKKRLSICVVSHNAYRAISGGQQGHIGGVEWQTTMTARWLAKKKYTVSLITWDEGGPPEENIDGVKVIKASRQESGVPGLRFFHPKWTGLVKALRKADAHVYYHNLADCETGQVALWCKRHKRGFVFSVPSNPDCDPALPKLKTIRERVLYRLGLKLADTIIVQNQTQKRMLKKGFGMNGLLIPMPCTETPLSKPWKRSSAPSKRILWVGRLAREKRPDRLIQLANECQDLVIDVVGPITTEDPYSNDVFARLQKVPNIKMHGGRPRDEVYEFYQRAACLCCTSDFEGFPNTFLEAWSCGLPVVSTFDPDGLIAKLKLGFYAEDINGMKLGINRLIYSADLYKKTSENARNYFQNHHKADVVLPKFEEVFTKSAENQNSGELLIRSQLR